MPDQDGLRFLFDIQDKITAKLAKIEAKSKASAAKIDKAFSRASKSQEANASKVIHTEKLRSIAVQNATAKATAARSKETAQGKILAQRLSAAQNREARQAANFRIAAAKRVQMASEKSQRKIVAASKRASQESIAIARKSVFALAALGAAFAAVSVKLVALGSDAEETENVTGLAFGEMKGAAEIWAASFAEATGSSRFESVELVSDLGLIVKGMGFTEEASLGMSSRMVELAADMSSAKNVPLDVALDKIRAGLIGESEPLRTMGVLLSEARVKQEAYASGIAETGTELTNTQKVQARMNIILADSAAMHGDLINTQDSVANQWRAIKNQVFDAATAMGKNLLPVASSVLGKLGEWVTKGADLLTWITKSEKRMKVFGAILAGVVVTGLGLAAAAIWALVPAITAATGGINLIIPAIAVGVGALVAAWILFGDTITDFLRKVWRKVKVFFKDFKEWFEEIPRTVRKAYLGIEKWLGNKLGVLFWKVERTIEGVTGFFGNMRDKIVGAGKAAYEGIKTWLSDKLGAIFDGIKGKIDAVTGFFSGMKDKIVGNSIVPDMVNLVDSEFSRMRTAMVDETSAGAAGVTAKFGAMSGAADMLVTDIGVLDATVEASTAATKFEDQWNTAMGNLTASISTAITDIWSGAGSPLAKLGNAFVEFGKGALSAITATLLTPVLNAVTSLATSIGKKLTETITGAITNSIASGFQGAAGGAGGASGGLAGKLGGGGANILGGVISGGLSIVGSIIGGFIARGESKTIEKNTRYSAIDLHGIRHGLASAEFTMAEGWPIHKELGNIYDTLSQTLWSIRNDVNTVLLPKIATLLTELKALAMIGDKGLAELRGLVSSSDGALSELRAIHQNTDRLISVGESAARAANAAASAAERAASAASKSASAASSAASRAERFTRQPTVGSGPEAFISSGPGFGQAHVPPGGGVDAKDVGKAVKEALQDIKVEVDGRKFGRVVVRHQPVAVAELGGRR